MTLWIVGWLGLGTLGCGSSGPTPCEPPGSQVTKPKAAGCLTVLEGRLLMVQSQDGHWTIPGGYVESGEESAAAAVRETYEEAGVKVSAGERVCASARTQFVAHSCSVVGRARPRPGRSETRDARFLTAQEIRALKEEALRFPEQRSAYLRALGVED